MISAKRLLIISRPLYYLPNLVVYAGGMFVSGQSFGWPIIIGALFFTWPMGIIVYGLNDIADRDSDALNPRKGGVDGAVLRSTEIRYLYVVVLVAMGAGIVYYLVTHQFGALLAVAGIYIFAYTYSLPPIRLKSRPGLDSLSNGWWLACMFLAGFWAGTIDWPLAAVPGGLLSAIFLCASAFHALGAVIDHESDKAAGERTISIALGKPATLILCALVFVLSIIPLGLTRLPLVIYLLFSACLILMGLRYQSPQAIRRIFMIILALSPVAFALAVIL